MHPARRKTPTSAPAIVCRSMSSTALSLPHRDEKLVRLLAQGGVEKLTGGSCGAGEYYQRARVTLLGVPSSARVWAFYDPSVGAKQYATFQENPDDDGENGLPNLANDRITSTAALPTLCDGTTHYVEGGTEGTLDLSGVAADLTTAGTYKPVGESDTSIHFDVYVPMEGTAGQSTSIFLALGFVVDPGTVGVLEDRTEDVGITAWDSFISIPPTFAGVQGRQKEEVTGFSDRGEQQWTPCL